MPYGFALKWLRWFLSIRLLGKLLGGWSINTIINAQSDIPVAVTQATNFNAFAGFGTQRPNLVRDPALPSGSRSTGQWFDVTAFSTLVPARATRCALRTTATPISRSTNEQTLPKR